MRCENVTYIHMYYIYIHTYNVAKYIRVAIMIFNKLAS